MSEQQRSVNAQFATALRHYRAGRLIEADDLCRKIHATDSGHDASLHLLGVIAHRLGRDGAADLIRRAVTINPDSAEAHNDLGIVLAAAGKLMDAAECFDRAVALKPKFAEAHNNLGNALEKLDRLDEAVTRYEKAIELDPDNDAFHNNFGNTLRVLGRRDEATRAFEKAVALAPMKAAWHWGLAISKRFTAADPHFAAMQALAQKLETLGTEDQIRLHFALGKAFADLGDHQNSARHLLEGNALKRRQITYHETRTLNQFERIRTVFTAELMHEKRGLGNLSSMPVFIVGMPRSGTTLAEQILASHPKVFGAGELQQLQKLAGSIKGPRGVSFPEAAPMMSAEQLRELAGSYLRALRVIAPAAERVIDKMPANFLLVGLIHLALPKARIIHIRRDPRDLALSCFSTLFETGQEFSYDLAELGRYYHAYQGLMQHWRKVLPNRAILDVEYEEVVADLDRQARRIIAHCGLEWDNACLAFYQTRRLVRTASAIQVRQPIYNTSVRRWLPYKELLQPFVHALEDRNRRQLGLVPRAKLQGG